MALIDTFLDAIRKYSVEEEDFTELDRSTSEEVIGEEVIEEEVVKIYVRVAGLTNLNDLALIKKEMYKGNILMVDISTIKNDRLMLDRALKGLKDVVIDIHGDIAGLKEDHVLVTPKGFKIDRSKIVSRRD